MMSAFKHTMSPSIQLYIDRRVQYEVAVIQSTVFVLHKPKGLLTLSYNAE